MCPESIPALRKAISPCISSICVADNLLFTAVQSKIASISTAMNSASSLSEYMLEASSDNSGVLLPGLIPSDVVSSDRLLRAESRSAVSKWPFNDVLSFLWCRRMWAVNPCRLVLDFTEECNVLSSPES